MPFQGLSGTIPEWTLLVDCIQKKQQDIVLKHEFFTIYMVLVYHIYIAVLLAIREQYSYNRIVLA